jgi:formate dehydrogenase subunit gamma
MSDERAVQVKQADREAGHPRAMKPLEKRAHEIAGAGFLVTAVTGFGSKYILGTLGGWNLLVHMYGAGLLLVGLVLVTIVWADRCRFGVETGLNLGQKLVFWISLALGLAIMLSMLLAMVPLYGTAGQHVLLYIHEYCGLLFLVVMIVHTVVSLAARRAQR